MKTASKVILGFFAGAGVAMAVTVTAANKGLGDYGWHGDHSERIAAWVERRLELDSAQSEQLQQLIDKFRAMRTEWRDQRGDTLLQVRDLIAAPTLDQAQVLALIEGKAEQAKAQAPEMVATVAAFADSLSAAQKQEVLDMFDHRMEHRMGRHHGRHWH